MDKTKMLLMTIRQASEALALSERSIYWLISTGRLASRKFGRRRLIPREAVERFAQRDHARLRPPTEKELGAGSQ